jgi:MOSC domain-containing protein
MSEVVGSVAELWRFPVKSMKGERLDRAELTERGVLGDRAYALVDADTGKVVSAKSVRLFPTLLACQAAFLEAPQPGRDLPPVRITLPDSTSVTSESRNADELLSGWFKRAVRLARAAPADFTIDQYHPDVEGLDPAGHRNTVVEQKLGSALFAEVGLASPVPEGSFFDLFPMSVVTTSTLDRLRELAPQSSIDARRFRMNVVIATSEPGFLENEWVGHELEVGPAARFLVALPDPRCVMTTLAQDELPADTGILRTLAGHNRIQVGDIGKFPCAGVYAVVGAAGPVRTGDRVNLI